jgi:hypothetical protein
LFGFLLLAIVVAIVDWGRLQVIVE